MFNIIKFLVLCAGLLSSCAAYNLTQNFQPNNFFSNFQFFTGNDPTHGYVNYLSAAAAASAGLTSVNAKSVYIGSDHTNIASGRGRNSVRLQSNAAFNQGLFVIDLVHMPEGCSSWPAFWMVGPSWPRGGEIDIIEGVNTQDYDMTTLHTKTGCSMAAPNAAMFTGTSNYPNCYAYAAKQPSNAGCGFNAASGTYGAPFNAQGGGVFALEWNSTFIRSFFFTHNQVPLDLTSGTPDPSKWGTPYAYFPLGTNCPASFFSNMHLVLDLTFCGDWAGPAFLNQCPGRGTCQSYVQNNPSAFTKAYWEINWIKVFK